MCIRDRRGATPPNLTTVRGFIDKGSANLVTRAFKAQKLPDDANSCAAGLSDFLDIYSAGAAELTHVFEGAKDALIHYVNKILNLAFARISHFSLQKLFWTNLV